MGLRFRKSIKIAKGVRVNFNKKSVGVTLGTKGFHHTINTSGRRTTSVGLPGTGLYYSKSSGGNRKAVPRRQQSATATVSLESNGMFAARPDPAKAYNKHFLPYYILGGLFVLTTFSLIIDGQVGSTVIAAIFAASLLYFGRKHQRIRANAPSDPYANLNAPISQAKRLYFNNENADVTWEQLVQAAQMRAPQDIRIASESFSLIQSTVDPETFFSRLELAVEHLQAAAIAESYIVFPEDATPSLTLQEINTSREDYIMDFIQRAYDKMIQKANALKTENGRRNRKVAFYRSMLDYTDKLPENCIRHLLSMMEKDEITEDECTK